MQFLIEQSKRKTKKITKTIGRMFSRKKTKTESETYENRLDISFAVRMLNGIFYRSGYDTRI